MGSKNLALHAQHQAAYRARQRLGLRPSQTPWSWLSLTQAREIAQEAFKTASWACRGDDVTQASFLARWVSDFEVLATEAARRAGVQALPSPAPQPGELPPADWRPQYPFYRAPGGQP